MPHSLILGGIRSGKSRLAEAVVTDRQAVSGRGVVYVATGSAGDGEMAERIRAHKARRPTHWGLVEEGLQLGRVLEEQSSSGCCLLVDCMSLWLSNLLHAGDDCLDGERQAFLDGLQTYPGDVVIVSNEVGLGTIGMNALTRRYCDELGWLNQALAAQCDQVVMSVAGLPVRLKGEAVSLS